LTACRICKRSDRDEIDRKIASGTAYRRLVGEYGLSLGLLSRHRPHITQEIQQLVVTERNTQRVSSLTNSLLERLETVISEAQSICQDAKATKSYTSAIAALNAVTRNLQLVGRITGELQSNSGSVHMNVNQQINISVYDNDTEFAKMIGEATKGFSVDELLRMKALVEGTRTTAPRNEAPIIDIHPTERGFIY